MWLQFRSRWGCGITGYKSRESLLALADSRYSLIEVSVELTPSGAAFESNRTCAFRRRNA